MLIIKDANHNSIYYHPGFKKEKDSLFGKNSSQQRQYANWLDLRLNLLEENGIINSLARFPNIFEKLSGVKENIYSIRRKGATGNPRSLFIAIVEDDGQEYYILLTAFKETTSGSYQQALNVAKQRCKDILDELGIK